jgi:hypothetical protein
MHNQQKTNKVLLVFLAAIVVFGGLSIYLANAVPEGASISGTPVVDTGSNRSASYRQDAGGRIISLTLSLDQQDTAWKAYVGNVTGTYVLKNSNNYSIYEWPLGATITGEVYISRNSSANFSTGAITCANNSEMAAEQTFLGMSSSASDNINSTFNSTSHAAFSAGYNNIP